MEFTLMDAAEYRSLEADALDARRDAVIEALSAEELPEGVTTEDLIAEQGVVTAEYRRRNAEAELRSSKLAAVQSGAGKVIASSQPAKQDRKKGFQHVSEAPFTDSFEYREALAKHVMRHAPMPHDMLAKARQERANAIAMNGNYNSVDDFANDFSTNVAIPNSLNEEILREEREYGNIHKKINETHLQGGVTYTEADLSISYSWIGDTETSNYQEQPDGTTFSFTWHQLEARFARTMLADALLRDNFKELLAPALAEGAVRAKEAAILRGTGTTQPLGILTDPRLIGQCVSGASGYIAPAALIIEVTEAQMSDWKFWRTLLCGGDFNRLYRQRGEWMFGDSTWNMFIDTLADSNNNPIFKADALNDDEPLRLRNRPVNLIEDSLLTGYEDAVDGEVFGIFGNLKNYTMNTQPGMPMSVVSWDDHENNARKTKVLTAMDGRVVNKYGWALLKKKVSA